jgi:energy-coupling factor transporter transmembrane protein EcfT
MTRAFWLGLVVATVTFLVLLFVAARVTESATDTVDGSNRSWLVACAIAGMIAGFLGDRVARAAPALAVRYAAAVLGPALLALLFALTTDPADPAGPWFALAISIAAATLGATARERLPSAQRRR